MIIPNKHSGYQAGIRVYPLGGGGGGGGEPGPAPVAPPPPRLPSAAPAPQFQTFGQGDRTGSLVQSGAGMRPSQLDYSRPIFDPNYADNITGYEQSSQFFQPVYQPQYQDFNMGNRMGVSQFGQQPFFGGFGGMSQMRTPFQQPMQQQFNPYTNSFGGGFGGGFMPQQQFQPQMNMGMQTPFSSGMSQPPRTSSGPAQAIIGRSSQMRGTPNVMRRAEGGITSLLDET